MIFLVLEGSGTSTQSVNCFIFLVVCYWRCPAWWKIFSSSKLLEL